MSEESNTSYLGCVVYVRLFNGRRDALELTQGSLVLKEPRIEIRLDRYGAKQFSQWLKENFDV
jgi:hypothetical protein